MLRVVRELTSNNLLPLFKQSNTDQVNRVIGFMVGRLEGAFRELMEDDLTLYPPKKWKVRERVRVSAGAEQPAGSSNRHVHSAQSTPLRPLNPPPRILVGTT